MLLARHLSPVHSNGRNRVYVYRGEGAGWRSVTSTAESLQRLLPDWYQVSTLTAAELLSGTWAQEAAMLVMPGGADLPYCKHLNGHGNALIQSFVQSGGSYLGLCAGAYYAAARVEFEPGSPLQVVGDRELAFFPGTARGAAYAGFDYQTEAGAVAAVVEFAVPPQLAAHHQQQHASGEPHHVLSSAVTDAQQGNSCSWWQTYDYCNGGPYFVTRQGQHDLSGLCSVEVLASYSALPHGGTQQQHQQQCTHELRSSSCTQHQQQQHSSQRSGLDSVHNSQQADRWQPAAAVQCSVGMGVAVLCGTHPEMEPHWLDVCGRAPEAAAGDIELRPKAVLRKATVGGSKQGTGGEFRDRNAAVALAGAPAASSTRHVIERGAVALAAHHDTLNDTNSGLLDSDSTQLCTNAQLVLHTQTLRSTLAASQQQRDLFLSCLLFKALWRQ